MIKLVNERVAYKGGRFERAQTPAPEKTMAYGILKAHNTSGDMSRLKIKFDAMASHDITYVCLLYTSHALCPVALPL